PPPQAADSPDRHRQYPPARRACAGKPHLTSIFALTIFALTTRGLESITAGEMARIPGLSVTDTAYRRVMGRLGGDGKTLKDLLTLKTPDDLFLHLADSHDLDHTRAALDDFRARAADLNITALTPPL